MLPCRTPLDTMKEVDIFYTSMIESIMCYNIRLWWSSMIENDKKALKVKDRVAYFVPLNSL